MVIAFSLVINIERRLVLHAHLYFLSIYLEKKIISRLFKAGSVAVESPFTVSIVFLES